MDKLIKFQTYTSAYEVEQVAELLREHGIRTEIIKAAPQYVTYLLGSFNNIDTYILNVPANDFERADKLLSSETSASETEEV